MKQRALIIYEFLCAKDVWIESSVNYFVSGSRFEFLIELSETFSRYDDVYRIKSITFFKSYE